MPWGPAPLFQLVIPEDAGPTDPRVEIGLDLPADLVARYLAIPVPETAVGGIIWYQGSTGAYFYLILTTTASSARLCLGTRDPAGTIVEYLNLMVVGAGATVTWGRFSLTLGTLLQTTILNNNLALFGVASGNAFNPRIILRDGTSITLQETASINLLNDGGIKVIRVSGGGNRIEIETGALHIIELGGLLQVDTGGLFTIDGRGAPRGIVDVVSSAASSAAIGAETVVATGNTVSIQEGHAYEVDVIGLAGSSVANICTYRIRQTNLAGAILCSWAVAQAAVNNVPINVVQRLRRPTGTATGNGNIVLTIQASAGTSQIIAGATFPRSLELHSLGPNAALYPNAPAF